MERLRTLFGSMNLSEVATVIASGNVLFSSRAQDRARLERRIETGLRDALGYEVATFLRSAEELAAIAAHRPFPGEEPLPAGHSISVVFLKRPPDAAARTKLLALATPTDGFTVLGAEAYWLRRGRISESKVTTARLERAAGGPVTARNVTTVRKLASAAAR